MTQPKYVPPPHLSVLALKNFRGFRECRLPLAPLTFLVGPNSSGKSSLFAAVMLIAQSDFGPLHLGEHRPQWIGELVDLGSFDDAVYRHERTRSIVIETQMHAKMRSRRMPRVRTSREHVMVSFKLRTQEDDTVGRLRQLTLTDVSTGVLIRFDMPLRGSIVRASFGRRRIRINARSREREEVSRAVRTYADSQQNPNADGWRRLASFMHSWNYYVLMAGIQRVSSGRAAPRRWYPVADIQSQGHYREQLFDSVRPGVFVEREPRVRDPRSRSRRVPRTSVARVLAELDIASSVSASKLSPYHSAVRLRDNKTAVVSNLIDVGFGASQVIPVIEACIEDSDSPLFVEEPEIHLHPRAQSVVGNLLAQTSLRRQVIVETHSVHMINKARLMIARGELPPEHVAIHYVDKSGTGSHVTSIDLDRNGDFLKEWPEGFFEERYQDTLALMELKS